VVTNTARTPTPTAPTPTVNTDLLSLHDALPISNQTVTSGQTATFSVAAAGTAPLAYQWKKNSVAISGAMSSAYTTAATTSSDSRSEVHMSELKSRGDLVCSPALLNENASAMATS